eukprot:9511432-Heterocapsa_arctica.AAC.1
MAGLKCPKVSSMSGRSGCKGLGGAGACAVSSAMPWVSCQSATSAAVQGPRGMSAGPVTLSGP